VEIFFELPQIFCIFQTKTNLEFRSWRLHRELIMNFYLELMKLRKLL